MKNKISVLFILLLALFVGTEANAQIDRSVRPEAGTAPEITIGEHQSFTLDNGLKVIVVENHKIPRVSYQLRVDVDPVMENDAIGFVSMAPKTEANRKLMSKSISSVETFQHMEMVFMPLHSLNTAMNCWN